MNIEEWNDLWCESFASHLEDDDLTVTVTDAHGYKVEITNAVLTQDAPGFRIYKYNPSKMIGTPEIDQAQEAEEQAKRDTKRKGAERIEQIRQQILSSEKPEYDPGYPYETVGELVQAMMREANGDAVKLKQVQKWADDLRQFLAGNLWGYNAKRAAEEARRAAQETKPDKKPEPERKPVKGEDNLLTIAGISKNGNGGGFSGR